MNQEAHDTMPHNVKSCVHTVGIISRTDILLTVFR